MSVSTSYCDTLSRSGWSTLFKQSDPDIAIGMRWWRRCDPALAGYITASVGGGTTSPFFVTDHPLPSWACSFCIASSLIATDVSLFTCSFLFFSSSALSRKSSFWGSTYPGAPVGFTALIPYPIPVPKLPRRRGALYRSCLCMSFSPSPSMFASVWGERRERREVGEVRALPFPLLAIPILPMSRWGTGGLDEDEAGRSSSTAPPSSSSAPVWPSCLAAASAARLAASAAVAASSLAFLSLSSSSSFSLLFLLSLSFHLSPHSTFYQNNRVRYERRQQKTR
mmetsp:Transcript_30650/g.80054  ORF Transcript_30650/g.80054 Transcript_30650/m.80054 type:complete len:281 (-) Transcript_30650:416-1258(-)